ncbi:MAG TPA: hypothetical protein VJN44_13490 [Roseateles sp.]|nr:hypothetical protein [Roseateles sp.]
MTALRLVAILLIAAGVAGLLYGKFSYTKDSHDLKLGPVELSLKEKETVSVPSWAGIGAIAAGVVLLLLGGRKP